MDGERKRINVPGLEAHVIEVLDDESKIPESPQDHDCLTALSINYSIDDFSMSRLTITEYEPDSDLIEGTVEGYNHNEDRPLTVWWMGKLHGKGEDEIREIVPKFPTVFVDNSPTLTYSPKFDSVTFVLALAAWFALEEGMSVQVPSLQEALRAAESLR